MDVRISSRMFPFSEIAASELKVTPVADPYTCSEAAEHATCKPSSELKYSPSPMNAGVTELPIFFE
jgi:hypothetical protein